MGGKSAPAPAPDYTAAAIAQGQSSQAVTQAQTNANRPNMITPWGTSTWQDQGNNDWTNTVTLSPQEQQAFQSQQAIQAGQSQTAQELLPGAESALSNPDAAFQNLPSLYNFGGPQQLDTNPGQANEFAIQNEMAQIQPIEQQQEAALNTQLANQGIVQGSAAWQQAQDQEARNVNNANQQAVTAGFTQGNTDFQNQNAALAAQQQLEQSYGGYESQLQNQQIKTGLLEQNTPLNELNALLTGNQVSSPTFNGAPNSTAGAAQATNYLGAATDQFGATEDNVSAQNASSQSMTSGMMSLAGTAAMFAM